MRKLLMGLFGLFGMTAVVAQDKPARADSQFVFVKIPEEIMPVARGTKYEDPIDASLKKANVGEVSGGGTQMSQPGKDGSRGIEWVGVDVDLSDFDRGLPILKSALIKCGAPDTTVLEYTRGGVKHSDPLK